MFSLLELLVFDCTPTRFLFCGSKSICHSPHIAQLTLCGLLNVRRKFASPPASLPGFGKLRIATQLCNMGCFFEFIQFISPISREGAIFNCSLNAFSVCKLTAWLPVKQIPLRPHQPHPQILRSWRIICMFLRPLRPPLLLLKRCLFQLETVVPGDF